MYCNSAGLHTLLHLLEQRARAFFERAFCVDEERCSIYLLRRLLILLHSTFSFQYWNLCCVVGSVKSLSPGWVAFVDCRRAIVECDLYHSEARGARHLPNKRTTDFSIVSIVTPREITKSHNEETSYRGVEMSSVSLGKLAFKPFPRILSYHTVL